MFEFLFRFRKVVCGVSNFLTCVFRMISMVLCWSLDCFLGSEVEEFLYGKFVTPQVLVRIPSKNLFSFLFYFLLGSLPRFFFISFLFQEYALK